ncbi:MAG: hypothetical protein KAG53_08845 [Endozoicomonadaceae bacterium]|nr:hypothetical protein [Endozoicomonadaceae bacterium]
MITTEQNKPIEMNITHGDNHFSNSRAYFYDTTSNTTSNDSKLSLLAKEKDEAKKTNERPICKREINAHNFVSNPELHTSSSLDKLNKYFNDPNLNRVRSEEIHNDQNLTRVRSEEIHNDPNLTRVRSEEIHNGAGTSKDLQVYTETTDTEETRLLVEGETSEKIRCSIHHKEITNLVREELDEFLTDMFFSFSKLHHNLIGPITCKEVATGFFSYLFSTINLTGLVRGNHASAEAWISFITAGWAPGAMYADAMLTVIIKDPVKLMDKIKAFKESSKLEQMKIALPMSIVCMAALYTPMLDAFNAHDGVINLFGGDATDPSTLYRIIGIIGGACNWGSESLLPMLLGLRLLSSITTDVKELLFSDKYYRKAVQNAAQQLTTLVTLYNQSIDINDNPNELILNVNNSDIITYKVLFDQLTSEPRFLEDVILTVHNRMPVPRPIMTRIVASLKIGTRVFVIALTGAGIGVVIGLPSLLRELKITGKVDCAKLRTRIANSNINLPLQTLKQHSYTVQGIFGMDNISSFVNSFAVIPYAIRHKIKHSNRGVNQPQPLTTNGLKRTIKTTVTSRVKVLALGVASVGAFSFTKLAVNAMGGAQSLAEAARCPNVTIPGVDEDIIGHSVYEFIMLFSMGLIFLIMMGGATSAWARTADRVCPTKKGPNVTTLAKHQVEFIEKT